LSKRKKSLRDKWRSKSWYTVVAPQYFGKVELGTIPAEDPEKIIGRLIESTLYDITNDFAHQYLKLFFQINHIEGKTANTYFRGHEYSRDYLRSLVRRRTTKVEGLFTITTKDEIKLRIAVAAFTLYRIRTSQEHTIRNIMKQKVEEKATALTIDQLAQEMVLGKIASDIYNEIKNIVPLRHVGVRKSQLITKLMPAN
jgi:small subunit ribosomal protein S3Ae